MLSQDKNGFDAHNKKIRNAAEGENPNDVPTFGQVFSQSKTYTGTPDFTGGIKADTVSESTTGAGVTVDSVLLKDGYVTQNGLSIIEGADKTMGSFSALIDPVTGNDVVVNTNKVTADSRIFLTVNSTDDVLLTVPTVYVFSRTVETSFTVRLYGDVAANVTVAWLIIEPA